MRNILLIASVLINLVACTGNGKAETKMLPQEQMQAHCVGRQIVELPKNFSAAPITTGAFKGKGRSAQDPFIDVVVRAGKLTPLDFARIIGKRRDELTSLGDDTTDVLRFEKPLGGDATLFRVQRVNDAYVSEIDFLRDASFVTARLKSYKNGFLEAEEILVKFMKGIATRNQELTMNSGPGFCLGLVSVTGEFEGENGSFLFRDGNGNAFGIEIDTYKEDASVPLLARVSGSDSLLNVFNVRHTVLRARERTVSGMQAQEWLAWTKLGQQGDQKTFGFTLETMRAQASKTTPSMHLSFDTGKALEDGSRTGTVISDDEAIQIWDSVVDSIRPATT